MMVEELGLFAGEISLAIKCGLASFSSFLIFGLLPVIPYVITVQILQSPRHNVVSVLCIGGVEMFSLGFVKATIIGTNGLKSGL